MIFTGDVEKNRAEILCGDADSSYDANVSRASIASINELWRGKPNNILVPGPDLPMVLKNGSPEFLGSREAAIEVWNGNDLDTTTIFNLTVQ